LADGIKNMSKPPVIQGMRCLTKKEAEARILSPERLKKAVKKERMAAKDKEREGEGPCLRLIAVRSPALETGGLFV
jgi:phosphate uptake regulator